MFINFFKIALRYLWRNKTFCILNLLCLTFGLTCAIIATLHIRTLVNHDKFHKNYERLYSVNAYVTYFNGSRFPKEPLSASLAATLQEQAPEIEEATRIVNDNRTFTDGNKSFAESGIYADGNLFHVFTFPVIRGNIKDTQTNVNGIAISERVARKFFGSIDCVGKTLTFKNKGKLGAYKITGVFGNVPVNSCFTFDYVIPISTFLADNLWANDASASIAHTWVLLKNHVNPQAVNLKIRDLIKKQESTLNQELFLFPMKDQILYSYADGKRVWRAMQNVVMESVIGFAILLIACFNFINLTIALNIKRHREVGIKKVTGSRKTGIILQFLGETFIITLISLFLALILTKEIIAGFSGLFGGNIDFRFTESHLILIFMVISLFTGLISGLFPALYLASSNPVNVLKGKIVTKHSYSAFRQGLIVFQFIIPIILIILMMIVKSQDKFIQNFNIGVDRDKLIVLDNTENIQQHAENVKADLLVIPEVEAVSFTNCLPTRGAKVSSEVTWEGKDASEKLHFWCINTDFDYNKALEIKMTEGRFFDPKFSTDSTCFVINDVAARTMKYKDPLGRTLTVDGKKGTVIGVFTNFHAVDLAGPFVPTIIQIKKDDRSSLLVKYATGKYSDIADKIGKVYRHYEPEAPFQPRTFREIRDYSNLGWFSSLVGLASVIAILLACLGLFGLASFTAASRTKEIGIRKANGARTIAVMSLLLGRYTKWLTIAFCIALPIAFLLGIIFLGRFFFHTPMPLYVFAAGPIIVFVIALLTVSGQAYRVASQNPVKSLRYE